MKKFYLLTLALLFTLVQYGQELAAIDRINGPTPTAAGAVANVSATGLTRTNVNQVGANTLAAFSSSSWETGAAINTSKYLEWSLKGNAGFSLILTELNIRYQRVNNQAPKTIDIYYSTNAFTSSTLLSSATYANNDGAVKTISIPMTGIAVGSDATITFRLYGYDAANVNGQLNINGNTTWAVGSVSNPGIRLRGFADNSDLSFNTGVWTPFAPNTSTGNNLATIVAGTYTPAVNIALNTLTVNPSGSLTVNSGIALTLASGLNLQSSSTQYSSLILNGTLTGAVTYNRHVNGYNTVGVGTGNDLISAPVTSGTQNFATFAAANSNLRTDPNNATRKLFGPFSKTTGSYQLWDTTVNSGEILTAGVGYRAATEDNGSLIFTGAVLNGDVTNNIINAGPQFASYNLIGNPYTSYINVREFLEYDVEPLAAVVRNIDLMVPTNAAIYGYDGNAADGWVIYNLTTPTTVNMAPGQGFLVTADAADVAAYDMTFTPSIRRIDTTDDLIAGRRGSENSVSVKLQAAIGALNYNTSIFFNDNCTSGLDFGHDAGVFGSNAPATAIYTHLVQDNTGVDMAIQSLAYADLGSDIIVPLGINVPQGQQVSVSIIESDLPSNIEVYLEDNVLNTFTLLNTDDYIFTPSNNLIDTGRFFLRFSEQSLSTPEENINGLQIYTTSTPRALFIKGLLASATNVSLYDVQGRLVSSSVLKQGTNSNQVDVSTLSSGVYVVKLSNSAQQKTQKIILK